MKLDVFNDENGATKIVISSENQGELFELMKFTEKVDKCAWEIKNEIDVWFDWGPGCATFALSKVVNVEIEDMQEMKDALGEISNIASRW